MSTVTTEHLWDKRRNKGLPKALVRVDLLLFLKPRGPGLQDAQGKETGPGGIPGEVSADGEGRSFPATFLPVSFRTCPFLHSGCCQKLREMTENRGTLTPGSRITMKSFAFCSANLHKTGLKRAWLGFQAMLFLHAAVAITVDHHLQGW